VKVHLVDGTFELFRCFHATPHAQAADGREIAACKGLMYTLVKLLRQPDVTHVGIAFDAVVPPTPGTKVAAADIIRDQTWMAADVVRALGILIWPMVRFSVDDALATAAARFKLDSGVDQIVICSTDNDFAQCVDGERVVVLDRIRDRVLDEAGVGEKFGVRPAQIPEYLALVGDPSDGLPGIPGWGAKSAASVLARYPTIEDIPDDESEWSVSVRGAARLAASLRERRREAYLFRNLSILRTDVPLPDAVEDLEWRGADRTAVTELAGYLGEPGIAERVPAWST